MRLPWDSVLKCDSAALDAVASGGSSDWWGALLFIFRIILSHFTMSCISLFNNFHLFANQNCSVWCNTISDLGGASLLTRGALSPQNYYLTEVPQQNKTDEAKRPSDFCVSLRGVLQSLLFKCLPQPLRFLSLPAVQRLSEGTQRY